MKVPMFRMTPKELATSKTIFAGSCMVALGVYVIVEKGDIVQGGAMVSFGFGIWGYKDGLKNV